VFERGGRLRQLEIYSVDEKPLALPDLDHVVWESVER